MAKFYGPTNLHLGGEEAWAAAQYAPETHNYVIDVSGAELKKFRAVAGDYGFVEGDAPATPVAADEPETQGA